MSIEQIRERSQKTGDFITQEEEDIIELLAIIDKRIPGTYEKGDRVKVAVRGGVEGTVIHDNRKEHGRYVWVEWDNAKGEHVCTDPGEIISVEAGL